MPNLYVVQTQWNHWPITLGMTLKGLRLLEFRNLEEVVDREVRGDASLKIVRDESAAAPFLKQVNDYFGGELKTFDLPLDIEGTGFQMRVWTFLQSIPYGQVASYQQAAAAAGNVKAVRAAGMANHRNPVSVIIPCHRVVGKNGALVGYGGGLDLKEALLTLEGIQLEKGRIAEPAAWMNNG